MSEKKKILLIEDETFIRELYERVLRKSGFEVVPAGDGEEGLTAARARPDLILLDIMLPKIHGLDVLKILKKDKTTKKIPVVLLTNLGQESIVRETFKLGAQGYLTKIKVSPKELVDYVSRFLNDPTFKVGLEV